MKLYMMPTLASDTEAQKRFLEDAIQFADGIVSIGGHTTYQKSDGSVVTEPATIYYVSAATDDEMAAVLAIAKREFEDQIAFLVAEIGHTVMIPR